MVVLDTYQSAGTVPFSVNDLNVDFATGGSVKWLCGGPGAGYLYVRPDLQTELQPKTTGWMAPEQPFAFETELRYAPRDPLSARFAGNSGPLCGAAGIQNNQRNWRGRYSQEECEADHSSN